MPTKSKHGGKREGAGRPRAHNPRSVTFKVRLTGEEVSRWQVAADRQGITLADLVRESVETCIARGSTR